MYLSGGALPQTQLYDIPSGIPGTRTTLKVMARLVREASMDQIIRTKAEDLVGDLPGQSFTDQVRCCFGYVRDNVRYLQDCNGVEQIHTPVVMLQKMKGDCDDMVTLLAALLESIGHPCRFVAVGYRNPSECEHVYLETRVGNDWISLDPTQLVNIGWAPIPPWTSDRVMVLIREYV